MRTVLDSVIFVRALINPFSQCGRLIFEYSDAYELIVSPQILYEYLDVLRRPELVRKYRTVATRSSDIVLDIIANATIVHPVHMPAVCRDPEDDKFLAAAEAGSADFIVSEDNDLLSLAEYKGTRICTAEAVLRELGRDLR
jgi:putative PIN family toxin of toxin-antitoxin system